MELSGMVRGMPPLVREAVEQQAAALAAGINPAHRPADVLALAGAARPAINAGVLSVDDARLAASLVLEAMTISPPRIQTNTTARRAVELLVGGGRLGNAYDKLRTGGGNWDELGVGFRNGVSSRIQNERAMGVFGTGTTVYGSVTFDDVMHRAMRTHNGTVRRPEQQLNTGATSYGDVSLVLKPRALHNATFLAADTAVLGGVRPVRPVEQLDDVATEWLVDHFQLGTSPAGRPTTYDTVFEGAEISPAKIADDFRSILKLPRAKAVEAIREHLTSRASVDGYMEAQVRIATADDVASINMLRRDPAYIPVEHRAAYQTEQDAVIAAAKQRGIPVRISD